MEIIVFLVFVFLFAFIPLYFLITLDKSPVIKVEMVEELPLAENASDQKLAKFYYNRYEKCQVQANWLFACVILVLMLGAIIFYGADSVARDEKKREVVQKESKVKYQIKDDYLSKIALEMETDLDSLYEVENSPTYSEINGVMVEDESKKEKSENAAKKRKFLEKERDKKYSNEMKTEEKEKLTPTNDDYSKHDFWNQSITTLLTRLIISFVTFFIAQILLRLYKYKLMLSGFYLHVHDVLLSYRSLGISFEDATRLLNSKLTFGNEPQNPFKSAIEAFKVIKGFDSNTKGRSE